MPVLSSSKRSKVALSYCKSVEESFSRAGVGSGPFIGVLVRIIQNIITVKHP